MNEWDWYQSQVNFKNQVIVDVGANSGTLTECFWRASEGSSTIIVVEPVPENLARIREKEARLKAHFIYHPVAVSDYSGRIRFMTASQHFPWGVNGQVHASQNTEYPIEPGDVEYECRKLSELVPDATMVKMDIEGHEYTVLPQALEELPKVHTWMLELHRRKEHPLQNTLRQFSDHGYSIQALNYGPLSSHLTWEDFPKHYYKLPSQEERWLKKLNLLAVKS